MRGDIFNSNKSETWSSKGDYALGLEQNLGYNVSGIYGLDTVALGISNDTDTRLTSHLIAEVESFGFPVGLFGLGQQQTNLSDFNDGYPSFLARLKAQDLIPSLSWSYTAGARYRE